jgi:hypothetical protein
MRATLVFLVGAALAPFASAAEIGQFNDWTAHSVDSGQGKSCYLVSIPTQKQPSNVSRDDVFFYVTIWAGQTDVVEPSVVTGYPYQPGSTTTISVGESTFSLFTKGDSAWIADRAVERQLIDAMKAGATMIVKGTSRRGTVTTDSYSLSGVTAGIGAITKACS